MIMINLKFKLNNLPKKPGVYIMKDSNNNIIYIGKAKILKRRISQYFINSNKHNEKVRSMVLKIHDFEYIIADSEFEALVLECSLIKKYKPKYNILLKDDKGYNYIKITNEEWRRISFVKNKKDDSCKYFGPYMSSFNVKTLVDEVNSIFKLPTCNRNFYKHTKPCLNYYINKCIAPCSGRVLIDNYKSIVDDAISFIKNGRTSAMEDLKKKMLEAAENLNFEKAAILRDRIKIIKDILREEQKVVSDKLKDKDVIAIASNLDRVSVHVFRFGNGILYGNQNFMFDLINTEKQIRTEFIKRYYDLKDHIPKNIILDGEIENSELIEKWLSSLKNRKVKIIIPARGEQLKLIKMCKNNAYEALVNDLSDSKISVLEELKNVLSLEKVPYYIEAYDISNLNGTNNVGGMVVFQNGAPLKSSYRRFKIRTVAKQDDYNSMREVLLRRIKNYKHNIGSNFGFGRLPDLVLVDGGIEHVRIAKKAFYEHDLYVPIFGMVKNDKHKTRAMTTDEKEMNIKDNPNIMKFITGIQDEVHRYSINYHKILRNKQFIIKRNKNKTV